MYVVSPIKTAVSEETVAVLQHLLDRAKRGEIIGLALCARTIRHREEISFTGMYRQHPDRAVNASMRMSWRMTQMQDDNEGTRP